MERCYIFVKGKMALAHLIICYMKSILNPKTKLNLKLSRRNEMTDDMQEGRLQGIGFCIEIKIKTLS